MCYVNAYTACERCQIVYILRLIPWICSVNLYQAGPPGNSSPKNADSELGSCEDSAADMEDQEACSSSSNLESPAELPVS